MNNYTSPDELTRNKASYTNGTVHQDEETNSGHEDHMTSRYEASTEGAFATDIDTVDTEDSTAEGTHEKKVNTISKEKSTTNASHDDHENFTIEEVETIQENKSSKDV